MSRLRLRAAACAALVVLCAAGLVRGAGPDALVALGGTVASEVAEGGRPAVVGVLVPAGTLKGSLSVKAGPGSGLLPRLALRAPDGTTQDQDALAAAGAKVKSSATGVTLSNLPAFAATGLYRVLVSGADDGEGNPTTGPFTLTVKGSAPKGLAATASNISGPTEKEDFTFASPGRAVLTASVKLSKVSPFDATLKVVSPSGDELDAAAFTSFGKDGSVSVKNFPLVFFGAHRLRVGSTGGGGDFTVSAKVKATKTPPPSGVRVPDALPGVLEPGAAGALDGTGTANANSVRWAQVSGTAVTLSSTLSRLPTFTAPSSRATLAFQLVGVNDLGTSAPVTAVVEVDRAPVADAGPGASVANGTEVSHDGASSLDLDAGDALSHRWEVRDGANAVVATGSGADFTWTPTAAETFKVDLTVTDDAGVTDVSRAFVVADGAGPAPSAGRPVVVRPQDSVFLSGLLSRSAAGGPPSSFSWTADPANTTAVTLADANGPVASFTAPKQPVRLKFRLSVDGVSSTQDDVTVLITTATPVNGSPVANATGAGSFGIGVSVSLSGSSSVDDGAVTKFEWSQIAGPALSFDPSASTVSFVPLIPDVYVFELAVHDDFKYGAPTLATVVAGTQTLPVADGGSNQTAAAGALLTLTGTGSQATQGNTITAYEWRQFSGADWYDVDARDAGFNPAAASPQMTVPSGTASLTSSRPLLFGLRVTDAAGTSGWDYVTATFTNLPKNTRPTVNASTTAAFFRPGATVALTASASDGDGDILSYLWSQVSGTTAAISNPSSSTASVTAPTTSGTLVYRVTVNDRTGESNATATADVTFSVNQPPAILVTATPAQGPDGTPVTLSGTGTTDPENDALSYQWTEIPPSVGSPVTLSGASTATATFTMPVYSGSISQRRRNFRLTVTDVMGPSFTANATIPFTPNRPPVISTFNSGGDLKIFYNNSAASSDKSESLTVGPTTDSDGDPVTFAWRIVSGPLTSSSLLSSTTASTVTFGAPAPTVSQNSTGGVYKIGATASDSVALSAESTAQVLVTVSWASDIYPLITPTSGSGCNNFSCHGSAPGGGNLVLSGGAATARTALLSGRVSPNDYQNSLLYGKLSSGAMPKNASAWLTHQINMVRDWIEPEHNVNPKPGLSNGAENN